MAMRGRKPSDPTHYDTGGARAYAAAGVPLHVIKELGRWQSEAFMVYITLTVDVLDKHMGQVHAQALLLEERKR